MHNTHHNMQYTFILYPYILLEPNQDCGFFFSLLAHDTR